MDDRVIETQERFQDGNLSTCNSQPIGACSMAYEKEGIRIGNAKMKNVSLNKLCLKCKSNS